MPVTLITKDKPTTWEPDPDPNGYTRIDSLSQFPILYPENEYTAKNVVDSHKDIFSDVRATSDIRENILCAAPLTIKNSEHTRDNITESQDDVFIMDDNNITINMTLWVS